MIDFTHKWDPTCGISWAKLLGMVHVPMFGAEKPQNAAEEAAILLDGSIGSFAFMRTENAEFADVMEPLSWSWSSCVRHMVTVLPGSHRMYVRRWDEPQTISKFEMPAHGMGAFSLLMKLEEAAEPRRPNVVSQVLEPFRQIRSRIGFALGGQGYTEFIFFETNAAVYHFKSGNFAFAAQVSAVAIKSGVSANARYENGVAVFTMSETGLMYEASIGGQKFRYLGKQ